MNGSTLPPEALLPASELAVFAYAADCIDQGWCEEMQPFIAASKPVFAAEYTDTSTSLDDFCPLASEMKIIAILKNRDPDAFREACP